MQLKSLFSVSWLHLSSECPWVLWIWTPMSLFCLRMLALLVQKHPQHMLMRSACLKKCLDYLTFLPSSSAAPIVQALCPLFQLSRDLQVSQGEVFTYVCFYSWKWSMFRSIYRPFYVLLPYICEMVQTPMVVKTLAPSLKREYRTVHGLTTLCWILVQYCLVLLCLSRLSA